MKKHFRTALALPALLIIYSSGADARRIRPQSNDAPQVFIEKGKCEMFKVGNKDETPSCVGVVVSSVVNNHVDFEFSSDDVVVIFSGIAHQVKPNEDTALQSVDQIVVKYKKMNNLTQTAVGSCRYSNPYAPSPYVDCTAEIDDGMVFHARFLSNGEPPVDASKALR